MPSSTRYHGRSSRKVHHPTQKTATALRYQPDADDVTPMVLAQKTWDLAHQLIQIAEAKGVPVKKDADLASLLVAAGGGEEIPIEAFLVVADFFRYLYQETGVLYHPYLARSRSIERATRITEIAYAHL
ncbi:MAG: EscU/YscU/HrcU family type III secretion system export apparatus switch protein [Alphaproteobacteria bacterium]|nr:EscU/YscU/HrcU family type III secretion system export apparatus switch protein [Alphaproteobacteria bacterium]